LRAVEEEGGRKKCEYVLTRVQTEGRERATMKNENERKKEENNKKQKNKPKQWESERENYRERESRERDEPDDTLQSGINLIRFQAPNSSSSSSSISKADEPKS